MSESTTKSLTTTATLNTAVSLFNVAISVLVGFLVSPALLSILGGVGFGAWKFCQRLLAFVSVAEANATQALKWTITNKQLDTDVDAKRRDIGSAVIVWFRFLPVILVLGALISWFSPHLLGQLDPEYVTPTRLTCAVLLLNLMLLPLRGIPGAVMVGMNLAYKSSWIHALQTALGGALMVLLAYVGWGIVGVASGHLLAGLAAAFLALLVARRSLRWWGVTRPRREEVRSFFGFSIWVLAWAITSKFIFASDVVVLGIVSSASLVSSYVLTNYTIQMVFMLSVAFVISTMPGLGGIVGEGDFVRAARIRAQIMAISWLISAALGTMILLWNYSFVSLWVGADRFVGVIENTIMVLLCIQLVFMRNDSSIIDVTLDIRRKVLLGVFSSVLSVGLAYLLGTFVFPGVLGVVVGLLLGRSVLTIAFPALVHHTLGIRGIGVRSLIRPLLATAILFPGAVYCSRYVTVDSWLDLFLDGSASFCLIAALAFFAGLSKTQRAQIIDRLAALSVPAGRFLRSLR
jgi:O-antigen/teichoic acid export membrane protein